MSTSFISTLFQNANPNNLNQVRIKAYLIEVFQTLFLDSFGQKQKSVRNFIYHQDTLLLKCPVFSKELFRVANQSCNYR